MTETQLVKTESASLKKQLGLVSTTSYITGSIIGVGIFISPVAVLEGVGSSVGLSLAVWTLCGALNYCAAMCYTEYGTRVKKSGGTYTYIREAFGDLAGFVFLWVQLVLARPLSTCLASLAAAEYIMRPVFLTCPELAPRSAKVMLGFVILGFFAMSNMYSVRLGARLQTLCTVCKVFAISTIIVAGVLHICQGHIGHFTKPFHTTNLHPGGVAAAIYAGLYAYGGWENVNIGVEEVVNPQRTIPIAILGGLAIPTLTYILANVAYHAVLTNDEILSGVAVAVMFGERSLGYFKWLILPCVAISAAGIANANVFTTSRLNFVGGRDGLFPRFLGMVNVQRRTPQPSIILLFILAVIAMCLGDVKTVLGAYSFFKACGEFCGVLGIFRIRRKHPANKDTFTVHLAFPIIYVIFFLILSITAIVYEPGTFLVPFLISLLGVPLFYISNSKWWKRSPAVQINGDSTYKYVFTWIRHENVSQRSAIAFYFASMQSKKQHSDFIVALYI